MLTIDKLLATLVALKPAPDLSTLTAASGADPSDCIVEAESAGLVEVWEVATGPTLILTPLGAARMRVQFAEIGPGDYRWVPLDWKAPRLRVRSSSSEFAGPDYSVDPSPGPVAQAIRAERAERMAVRALAGETFDDRELPRPNRFLGSSCPWNGSTEEGPCPICHGRKLEPAEYCLFCSSWGLQHLLPKVKSRPVQVAKPKPTKPATRAERRKAAAAA